MWQLHVRELDQQTMEQYLGTDRLPVGQKTEEGGMRGGGGGTEWREQWKSTEPLILVNDCRMLTHVIAVICLPYHLCPSGTLLIDDIHFNLFLFVSYSFLILMFSVIHIYHCNCCFFDCDLQAIQRL